MDVVVMFEEKGFTEFFLKSFNDREGSRCLLPSFAFSSVKTASWDLARTKQKGNVEWRFGVSLNK